MGALLQPAAGFRDHFEPFAPQEVGDHGHEGVGRLLLVRHDEGAVGEAFEDDARLIRRDAADLCNGPHRDRLGRKGERSEDADFLGGEAREEVVKDEGEGVIPRRATAEVRKRIADAGAMTAAYLSGYPAKQQRPAPGFLHRG